MGFGDREITALTGAHTLGRAYHDRSGLGKEVGQFNVIGCIVTWCLLSCVVVVMSEHQVYGRG
jgi:hypothetical protein